MEGANPMESVKRLAIVLAVGLLPALQPLTGSAQPPAPPPAAQTAAQVAPPAVADAPSTPSATQLPRGATERTTFPQQLTFSAKPQTKTKLEIPPPPGGEVIKLDLPPLEPGDLRYPINLATSLRLSNARPLLVAAAQASAWIAEAQLQKAKVLWLPDLNLGFDYIRHDGYGPDTIRGVNIPPGANGVALSSPGGGGKSQNQNINFFYAGGAFFLLRNSTDMIFEPLAARQNLNAKRWDIQSAKNDALLMTARAYFNVHKYRGQYAGAIDTIRKGRRLVEKVSHLREDLVPAVEVDRARTLLANLEQLAVSHRQNWRRASADLSQVLRLDPRMVVEPLEQDHLQFTMIDPSRSLDELIPIALTNRPELAAHQAMVQATLVRIRQEKMRPLLPVIEFNGFQTPYEQIQVGAFGIGNGGKMNLWSGRFDFSPQLMWQFDGLGFGNAAMVKWRRGEASQETVRLFQQQDAVAGDVTRAQARLQSAATRVFQSERELRGALNNYNGVYEGLGQTQRFGNVLQLIFRPQEAVFSLHLLKLAYDAYYATVAEYNTAQFELFHALGYPAQELAVLRPTGELQPVDTTRPGYLPPVGIGPPPPTR